MANDHKDYSGTPLPKKLGIKEGSHVFLVSPPDGFDRLLTPMPADAQLLAKSRSRSTSASCSPPSRRS